MDSQGNRLFLDGGDLAHQVDSLEGILRLAEPWLVDAGLIVPTQALEGTDSKIDFSQLKAAIDAFLFSKSGFMSSVLCEQLDYCNFRLRYQRRADIIKATADALCTFMTGIPVPIVLLAAYIVEDGYCDRLCNCGKSV